MASVSSSSSGKKPAASSRRAPSPSPSPVPVPAPVPVPVAAIPVEDHSPMEELPLARLSAHETRYPVDFVLANDGSGGDSRYCLELTDRQIRRLLSDNETPRFVRIPIRYFLQSGLVGESRFLRVSNCSEVHIGGGWEPPTDWEWQSGEE